MTEFEKAKIAVRESPEQSAMEGARVFVGAASDAISSRGSFRVALAGGSTPRRLYEDLAQGRFVTEIDWMRVHVFFSDERFAPADSPESNYNMVKEALLSRIRIPDRYVHRVATENITPVQSATLYEQCIRRVFGVDLAEVPNFDLIMLGLGPDGHTASMFPETEALSVTDALVAANFVSRLESWRITFTYPLINTARKILFLVLGEDKAEVAARVLAGDWELPAARVRPVNGEVLWVMDRAASSRLSLPSPGSLSPSHAADQKQKGQPA